MNDDEIKTLLDSLRKEVQDKLDKKQKQIEALQHNEQRELAMSHATRYFHKESEDQAKIAKKWLLITVVMAIITVVISCVLLIFSIYYHPADTSMLFSIIASKLILMAILITATLWSGKIYKSAAHLEVINRHKALVLQTFEALRVSVSNNSHEVKNAILAEATKVIFSIPTTGYIEKEDSELKLGDVKNAVHTVYLAKKTAT